MNYVTLGADVMNKIDCSITMLGRNKTPWGSPGLVVMGDESCSRGHGFKSRRCILDGHFITSFVVKIGRVRISDKLYVSV